MTDEQKPSDQYSDPTRYRILEGGAIYGIQEKKIVAHLPGPQRYSITKENVQEYVQRRVALSMAAKVRALARKQGVDVENATDEELVTGYRNALEALHGHAYDLAMKSTTGRGMEGIYAQLIRESSEEGTDPNAPGAAIAVLNSATASTLAEVMRDVLKVHEGRAPVVIDVKSQGEK